MPVLVLGNTAPLEVTRPDPKSTAVKSRPHPDLDESHTIYSVPPSTPPGEFLLQLQGTWFEQHSGEPPAWVRSDDEALASLVASTFAVYEDPKTGEMRDHEVKLGAPKSWSQGPDLSATKRGARSRSARSEQRNRLVVPRIAEARALAGLLAMDWPRHMMRLEAGEDPLGLKTNAGNDFQGSVMGGDLAGETGTSTAAGATSLTTNSGVTHAANDLVGHVVVVADATTSAYGVITANTSGTNTVLTVDKWSTPSNPGGAAATTPAAASRYVILPGGQPAFWMAITTDATAPAATDTTLASELAVSGLTRKPATYSHTAGTNTYALVATFTNPDTTARTINKLGIFNASSGGRLVFESAIPNPPPLASATDTVTPTETVTM